MLTVKVPVVPRSGPGPLVQDRPLEEAGRTDGETSRIPCEGHPDQRMARVWPYAFRPLATETSAALSKRGRSATGRSFMLPMLQQRQFEAPRFREAFVMARFAMGPALLWRQTARLSLSPSFSFHNHQATRPLRRLAPSTTRENAGWSASVRTYNGRQNADRRDPSGGDPGGGATRQPGRGIRLRVR